MSVLERKLAKVQRQAQAARERRAKAEARSRQLEQRLKRERAQATRARAEHRETMGAAERVAFPPAREARGIPAGGSSQACPPPTAQTLGRRHYRCGLYRLRAGLPARARPAAAVGRSGGKRTDDVCTRPRQGSNDDSPQAGLGESGHVDEGPLLPAPYAQATWHRLAPFFRLPGRIVWGTDTVTVELRPLTIVASHTIWWGCVSEWRPPSLGCLMAGNWCCGWPLPVVPL
jgi:hypothetical protein